MGRQETEQERIWREIAMDAARTGRALADALQDLRDARLEAELAGRRARDLGDRVQAAERARDEAQRSAAGLQSALAKAEERLGTAGEDVGGARAGDAGHGGPGEA